MSRSNCCAGNQSVGCALFETGMAWYWPDYRIRALMQVEWGRVCAPPSPEKGCCRSPVAFWTLELNARMFGLLRPGIGVYRPNTQPVLEYNQVKGRTSLQQGAGRPQGYQGDDQGPASGEALLVRAGS